MLKSIHLLLYLITVDLDFFDLFLHNIHIDNIIQYIKVPFPDWLQNLKEDKRLILQS